MSWRSLFPGYLGSCPEDWELSRAFSEGALPEVAIHLRRCERCSTQWAAMERTREVANAVTGPAIGVEARQRILSGLLIEVGSSNRSPVREAARWRWALALAFGAVAIIVLVGRHLRTGNHRATDDASAVAIHAIGAATFTRERPLPDELIRLDDGTLQLEVGPLATGQHLRIATVDAQLETEGGSLEVSASDHQLVAVRVWRGHTEVHGASFHVRLKPGDQWTRAATASPAERALGSGASESSPTTPRVSVAASEGHHSHAHVEPGAKRGDSRIEQPSPTPRSPAKSAPVVGPPETLPPTVSAPQRASFERGWNLLRAGDPVGASTAFREVEGQSPGDAIAEDAMFWRGVAEARAGAARASRDTLSSFVSRFPHSARAGEASAMLGWMLLEGHDLSGARQAFERARVDPVDRVRSSAEEGLARLAAPPPPDRY